MSRRAASTVNLTYLSADPTVPTPVNGDAYINSSTGRVRVYVSSAWVDANAAPKALQLTDAATVTPVGAGYDVNYLSTLSQATNIANPAAAGAAFQRLMLRIKSTTARALTWGTVWRAGVDVGALPSTTSGGGLTDYFGFVYNEADTKWDLIAVARGY